MCNIHNLNGRHFRFELYNLNYFKDCNTEISGHYTFWFDVVSRKYVFCKHGDYHNLVSIRPVNESPRIPSDDEVEVLMKLIEETTRKAYYYNGNESCNRGKYLIPEIESRFPNGSEGKESVKNEATGYYDYFTKSNTIFDVDYPGSDYKADESYWKQIKQNDDLAIQLLT